MIGLEISVGEVQDLLEFSAKQLGPETRRSNGRDADARCQFRDADVDESGRRQLVGVVVRDGERGGLLRARPESRPRRGEPKARANTSPAWSRTAGSPTTVSRSARRAGSTSTGTPGRRDHPRDRTTRTKGPFTAGLQAGGPSADNVLGVRRAAARRAPGGRGVVGEDPCLGEGGAGRKARAYEERVEYLCDPTASDEDVARISRDLLQHRPHLFEFVRDARIPWHNNAGERAIRSICVKRKMSGGMRSEVGTARTLDGRASTKLRSVGVGSS